jgi:alpha 1,2-mannosyltransferase
LQISIHYIVSFTHEPYGRATSISNVISKFTSSPEAFKLPDSFPPHPQLGDEATKSGHRANATFVILCRNSDMGGTLRSIRDIEDRFNRKYGYPYVLLNEEPFTDEFKK